MITNTPNDLNRLQKLHHIYDNEFTLPQLEIIDSLTKMDLTPVIDGPVEQPWARYSAGYINKDYSREAAWLFDHLNSILERANSQHWGMDLWGYSTIQYCEFGVDDYQNWHTDLIYRQISEQRKLTAVVDLGYPPEYQGGTMRLAMNYGQEAIPGTRGRITVYPSWCRSEIQPVTQGVRRCLRIQLQGPKFR